MTESRPDGVAVIVPNFNKEKVLRACLESVYAQTHPPAEVVVVDDRSTDRSPEIAREFVTEFAPPCKLIELPVNRGPSAARNAGVAASTAPLLFFVDSDTALEPDAIENAVRVLRETPDCGMVQGIYHPEPLFDDGPVEAYRVAFEYFWRRRSVGRRTATLFTASLVTREAFDATGGLDECLRHGDGEDAEFGTRLPERYRLVVTDTVLTRHDDVDRFWPFLREQWRFATRTPMLMRKVWRRRNAGAGMRVHAMSPTGLALSGLSLLTLPFVAAVPSLALVWLALLIGSTAASHDFLRYAYRFRGAGFAAFTVGMHTVLYAVAVLGTGIGALRVGYAAIRGIR
ncbi:glycosyltransferase family 2 protein [Phytohabitans aurantiacus]|uniref:glycosyltransferase family 2 protein n=1 Tax=Phytohabitans aurantiacus TaxID=3016789 RepID=UPI00249117DB|nr:glycosyltransferase family A protein [Phytohabitans aurantiacus]